MIHPCQNKYRNWELVRYLKVCLCVREGKMESMPSDTPYIHLEPAWHVAVCLPSGEGLPLPSIVWHKGVEDGRVIRVWHWENVWALSRSCQCDVWSSLPFLPLPTEKHCVVLSGCSFPRHISLTNSLSCPSYCLSGARQHLSITQLPPLDHSPARATEDSVHKDA